MILTNISNRIINVGPTAVLPGAQLEINAAASKTPAMRARAGFNMITLEGEDETADMVEEEPAEPVYVAAAETNEAAEEAVEKTVRKGTRGKKASE